jgi:TIR domain
MGQDFLDPGEVAPLIEALDHPAPSIRAVMFEALARLPLAPSEWMRVARFAARASETTASTEERLAVIDVAACVPLRSIRERVKRLAAEDADEEVRARATQTAITFELDDPVTDLPRRDTVGSPSIEDSPLRPAWAGGKPLGFTWYSASERASARAELATIAAQLEHAPLQDLADYGSGSSRYRFGLKAEVMAPVLERDLAPAAVTALFERARTEGPGFLDSNSIAGWVESIQGQFRPDIEGLFSTYLHTALAECERWPDDRRPGAWFLWFPDFESWWGYRSMCWQIGWTVSRGGLRDLVPALTARLHAADDTERIAAALLIADAADYVLMSEAPIFGGGYGPEHRVRAGGFLPEEPVGALEPAMLRSALRDAALRGILPALKTAAAPASSSGPTDPMAPLEPQPREREVVKELRIATGDIEVVGDVKGVRNRTVDIEVSRFPDRSMRRGNPRSRPLPLLGLAASLVVLLGGGMVVAAKLLLGWFVDLADTAADWVQFTVFSPLVAAPGSSILVQAFVHLPEEADEAHELALRFDTATAARTFRTLTSPVSVGSRLDFELDLPGLEIDDPVASLVWRHQTEAVQFGVHVPAEARVGTVIGTLTVSRDSAPLGYVKFKLTVEQEARPAPSEPQGEGASRYKFAFISYSSKDRPEVLRRVQMLSSVGIEYFQDVLSLEPGDRFARKIELGIDKCDLFLLFWSNDAKTSEWVRKEVQHALSRKAGDDLQPPEIKPVIVEGPPIVKPWKELDHLHFNDRLLYFMGRPTDD